ncbi:uncharacterized protein CDV56_108101 [Aspergillus thermomutatus]|uniref:Zn(2)-C6 fungal-type domain-containing protein n=1 Tax=Aspergillus thermomutatus TaxID=41047 RepID=A0A397HAT8_ASPTH|nr:uncharacterized protein CDV56_108101 [Aspergillus thermomutatus]RHZ57500.1 hypothetical protein CDV56_108101 [Aspergillus thermomutatus]
MPPNTGQMQTIPTPGLDRDGTQPRKRPRPVISCIRCRQKKLKCDRVIPCENCSKARCSSSCAFYQRPGSSSNANSMPAPKRIHLGVGIIEDLQQRLARVEELISIRPDSRPSWSAVKDGLIPEDSATGVARIAPSASTPSYLGTLVVKGTRTRYHGQSNRTSFLNQFPEAKDFLRQCANDPHICRLAKEVQLLQSQLKLSVNSPGSGMEDGVPEMQQLWASLPPRGVRDRLVELYTTNFEKTLRILHVPTFLHQHTEFWEDPDRNGDRFSAFMAQLTAVLSIAHPLEDRQFRQNHESTWDYLQMSAVDIVRTWLQKLSRKQRTDFATLQTETLVLLARRLRHESSEELWRATGTLVRSAMAMGLHLNLSGKEGLSAFQVENRRRLWITIVEMDVQASIESGMPVAIPDFDFGPLMPTNVNDADYDEFTADFPPAKPLHEWTDTLMQVTLASSLRQRIQMMSLVPKASIDLDPCQVFVNLHRDIERSLQQIPPCLKLESGPTSNDKPGLLLNCILLDLYIRRALHCLCRPIHKAKKYCDGEPFLDIQTACLESSLAVLAYQHYFDPTVAGQDDFNPTAYWDVFQLFCKNDILWAALSVCHYIKLPTTTASHTKASLTRVVENALNGLTRVIGQPGSNMKDVLLLAVVLQSVRARGSMESKKQLIEQGMLKALSACQEHLLAAHAQHSLAPDLAEYAQILQTSQPIFPSSSTQPLLPDFLTDTAALAAEFGNLPADLFDDGPLGLISSRDQNNLAAYICQSMFIILPPSLYAATIYMIYSRIVMFVGKPQFSIVAPRKITKIFVMGDTTAFLLQLSGGGMQTIDSMRTLGQKILLVGLFVQLVFFGFFLCVNIEKLADGMHSKAVRFTMDDGFQAVGKVPNPNAGLPHFTTASEVATMDFMRNVLGTPAPKVFSWSSTTDNAVGAEYILMENVRGVQLSQIWDRLNVEVKLEVLKKVALYQDSWAQTRFSQYGSLYYKQDLAHSAPSVQYTDTNGQDVVDDRFAVGPSMSRQNTDDGRAELHFDRGPWHTAEDYERATGLRESYCIRNIPQLPRSPIAIYYSGTYQPSREKKLLAAESYLKLVKFLMPDDESIRMSHIWHNDLHTENIFVNPDNPSEIYGFIDWQSTELAPLYDHTLEPYFLDYDGPSLGGLLERPRLEDIRPLFQDEPEPVASRKANSLFTKMSLVALYRYFVRKKSMRLFKALEYRQTLCFHLLLFARNLLVDGEATYLELLANQQQENWVGIPKISQCNEGPPLSFSKDMLEEIEKDSTGATTSIMLMQEAQQMIGEQYFRAQGVPVATFNMHSWIDRPRRDGKDADEWKPTSESEAAANIDEWYQAGQLLFPRDTLQDVYDQLQKPLTKGDSIYVKAFDGSVYEYPVRTGDTKTMHERNGDNGEDKSVEWVLTTPHIYYRSFEGLKQMLEYSLSRAYCSVGIRHWMTRVDQEPEPLGKLDSGLEFLHTTLRDWEGSEAWREIKSTLSSLNLNSKIAKVIGMACGTFTTALDSRGSRRSAVQHAFLLTLKRFLQESNLGNGEVTCYVQDPGYSKTDRLLLEKSDMKVLEDPEGFLEMDDASLVFSCAPNICVKQIVADIVRPLVLIWCTVQSEDPKCPWYVFFASVVTLVS